VGGHCDGWCCGAGATNAQTFACKRVRVRATQISKRLRNLNLLRQNSQPCNPPPADQLAQQGRQAPLLYINPSQTMTKPLFNCQEAAVAGS
jgi:hypothetical protein